MKHLHRLIVNSNTYRIASTPNTVDAKADPDDVYLWRFPYKRMEAEVVRDNMLWVSGQLDLAMGGPDIDHNQGLTSKRRSIYLRIAAEKEVEFLKIFDGPSVTECYRRNQSVMPQQALALSNSELAIAQAKIVAKDLNQRCGPDTNLFIQDAFLRILCWRPTAAEVKLCQEFLKNQPAPKPPSSLATVLLTSGNDKTATEEAMLRGRENLVRVLFNHNDFVTVR